MSIKLTKKEREAVDLSWDMDNVWAEGRRAFFMGLSEDENPYTGLESEYWSDGWEDAEEDIDQQKERGHD